MGTLLALDIGTTAAKASLFGEEGNLIGAESAAYPTRHPRPGWAEQNPAEWWEAIEATCRRLQQAHPDGVASLAAIGLSGHMNGCVLVTTDGTPVRPAIIHSDLRAAELCQNLAAQIPGDRVFEITGHPLAPYFSAAKLAWLARHEDESIATARWCLQSKDWLAGRLTDRFGVTDPSDASLTGLFDLDAETWSDDLCTTYGVPKRLLPQVLPSVEIVGRLTPAAAASLYLPEGTPVVLGGGDGACTTAGAGAVHEGLCYVYLGSTAWIASLARHRGREKQICMGRAAQPESFFRYGTVQSAGSAIDWVAGLLGVSHEELERLARQALPEAAASPLFLPQLQGERVPFWDPEARGALVGMRLAHTPAELARAAYEGVALALKSAWDSLYREQQQPRTLAAAGGGARSRFLVEVLAAALQAELNVLAEPDTVTSRGAAMCAAVATGIAADWQDALRFVPKGRRVVPEPRECERMSLLATRYSAAQEGLRRWRRSGSSASLP